jgi:hypothetical protein
MKREKRAKGGGHRACIAQKRGALAKSLLSALFKGAGWAVKAEPDAVPGRPDLIVRRRGSVYAVRVKVAVEGRGDRLVPLLAQAILESARGPRRGAAPLAVVAAPRVPSRTAEQVMKFAGEYAPGCAVGVIDLDGFAVFRGPHLDELNAQAAPVPPAIAPPVRGQLFSDLNQWMLKVLLAPELPQTLLLAPRAQYANASKLAQAAGASVMSAFRLVQQLRQEGYLDEAPGRLRLVRRGELFTRWQASAVRSAAEVGMRFVLPGNAQERLAKVLASGRACRALFAAADALKLGHASIALTADLYGGWLSAGNTNIIDRLERRLTGHDDGDNPSGTPILAA